MNMEAQVLIDPIAQQDKFSKIQDVGNRLDAMFEAAQTVKKELQEFKPVVQVVYVQMHQLDSIVNTEWQTLLTTKPTESDVVEAQ